MSDFNGWTFAASLVGPTIAALALRHAVKRGDVALREWRVQKLAEKRADVAVKALAITLRYAHVIRQVVNPATFGKDERPEEEKFNERWAIFDKLDNEFNDTIWLVRAQLGDAEADAINEVWNCKSRLKANQMTYLSDKSMFEHAHGSKAAEGLGDMLTQVRDLLQPHIRMEQVEAKKLAAS